MILTEGSHTVYQSGRNSTENLHPHDIAVSVVLVGWNTRNLLEACLASVFDQTGTNSFEVLYVDNASEDGSTEMVREKFPSVTVIANADNRGFVAANNQAIAVARGRYVLLLNSDTLVLDHAIEKTAAFADLHPEGAVFGCRVINPDGSLQRSCFMYPSVQNFILFSSFLYKVFPRSRFFGREHMTWWNFDDCREVETVCGCFSLVRRKAIDETGAMDPVFFFYGDDPDWCYRFRKNGWKVLFTPEPKIIHYGGQSSGKRRSAFKLQLFGSELLFMKLHRSVMSFTAARLLVSLFFLIRVPLWLAKGIGFAATRTADFETAHTYLRGSVLSLFDWKGMLMNRTEVERRLSSR